MQAQVNLSALNSEYRKKQITELLIQNEDHLLNKFSGDRSIPADKILPYVFKEIINRVSNGDSIAEGLLDKEAERATGLVIGEFAQWDSEQFGQNMGKIVLALFNPTTGLETRASTVHSVVKRLGTSMVSARISLKDLKTIQALESEGALLTDVLLTLRFEFDGFKPMLRPKGIVVDSAKEDDESELRRLGTTVFTVDRFHGDPHLSKSKSDEAYGTWVSNSLHGLADIVLVARRDSQVIGFITCKIENAADHCKFGVIDLVGVNPSYSGLGVGHDLLVSALKWFQSRVGSVYVGTQASNSRAVRLYEKSGFRHVNSEATFHLWPTLPS